MRKEETEADDGDDYGDNDVDADDGNNNDDGDDAVSHRTADEERGPRLCIFALTCPFNFFSTHPDPLSILRKLTKKTTNTKTEIQPAISFGWAQLASVDYLLECANGQVHCSSAVCKYEFCFVQI